jgi:rhodanese-related sulfurtransferase
LTALAYTESMLDYEISSSEAAALLKDGNAKLIDVREPWEFATAHIEGSVPMPMGESGTRPGGAACGLVPSRHALDECNCLAAQPGI